MVTIEPISEKDLEVVSRELRRTEWDPQWLGMRAIFVGGEPGASTFAKISLAEAQDLLCLRNEDATPVHNPHEIAAWQFSFSGSQHLGVLHALAPENDARAIREAHTNAVLTVLRESAGCLANAKKQRGYMGLLLDEDGDLRHRFSAPQDQHESQRYGFVVLTAVMSSDQSPNLHTTAILNNTAYDPDGSPRTLARPDDISRIRSPLQQAYAGALDYFAEKAIGAFHRVPHLQELRIAGIPQQLVQRFFFGPCMDGGTSKEVNRIAVTKEELFTKWRAEGQGFGWGAKEANALLRGFKREQFWDALRARCTHAAIHPAKALLSATASLSRLMTREKDQKQPPLQDRKDKDNHHTQSHSQ